MTKYYYAHTNADTEIIGTDGKKYFVVGHDNGREINFGIEIYPDRDKYGEPKTAEKIAELSNAYSKAATEGMLYSVEDMEREDPDRVFNWKEDESFFEIEGLLCEF